MFQGSVRRPTAQENKYTPPPLEKQYVNCFSGKIFFSENYAEHIFSLYR